MSITITNPYSLLEFAVGVPEGWEAVLTGTVGKYDRVLCFKYGVSAPPVWEDVSPRNVGDKVHDYLGVIIYTG